VREQPIILITGATDGLGRALADRLASRGARLILHGRDAERLASVADEIAASGAERPRAVLADLADLRQVAQLAEDVAGMTNRLDVLVNNAGVGSGEPAGRERSTSADGYELRFAVNYLAGFRLTLGLLPRMRVARAADGPARIVMVSSGRQHALDFGDLMLTSGYTGQRAYGQSKLAQIMFGIELAHRLPASEITVNSLHPASLMPTKIVLNEHVASIDTLEAGVDATARLAVDPAVDGKTGRFFHRQLEAEPHEQAHDPVARRQLWLRSLELTRIHDPFA
jgi:NAD(P)-dependent dehydrogenase (short-subunit alcohol dehydrogenase family)